jgi:hypothetical protein
VNYPRPDVPDEIQAPAAEQLVLRAHASGAQIYICQPGPNGKPAWSLRAPEAELTDQNGKAIGRHYAGPTWKHNDGSEVTAKAAARVDAPNLSAIPWVLLTATGHSGNGVLSRVTTIQRINTIGGQPPAGGCDETCLGKEFQSSYSAEYYFYARM